MAGTTRKTGALAAYKAGATTADLISLMPSVGKLSPPFVSTTLAYAESMVAAQVLIERLGPNFPVFLEYVGNGTSVEQSLLMFKISPADIEREWQRRTRAPAR